MKLKQLLERESTNLTIRVYFVKMSDPNHGNNAGNKILLDIVLGVFENNRLLTDMVFLYEDKSLYTLSALPETAQPIIQIPYHENLLSKHNQLTEIFHHALTKLKNKANIPVIDFNEETETSNGITIPINGIEPSTFAINSYEKDSFRFYLSHLINQIKKKKPARQGGVTKNR